MKNPKNKSKARSLRYRRYSIYRISNLSISLIAMLAPISQTLPTNISNMKSAIIAALIGSAAAFAPAQNKAATTSLNAFEDELGVQEPLGFFDPFGMLSGDCSQERFDRLRYVELKHGRISQLAFLGQIVTRYGIHLPGDIDTAGTAFDSIPNGWAAVGAIPQAGLLQIIAFVGTLELFVMKDVTGTAEFPGDFRNGALDFGWDTFSEKQKISKRAIELNNGRAAMMGILGLMVHEEIAAEQMEANAKPISKEAQARREKI